MSFSPVYHIALTLGLLAFLILTPAEHAAAQAESDCLDTEANLNYWQPIYDNRESDTGYADDFALGLVSCLGSENQTLRDTYGYGLFSYWLRNDLLRESTKLELFSSLQDNLDSEQVLLRSFSALIMSELLRADAQQPFLTLRDRNDVTMKTITALAEETDFRGLDAELGWVHPVAHMADVLWRMALHPQLTEKQARKILAAIYAKAVTQEAGYITNESERLARVVVILIRTEILELEEILTWFDQLAIRQNGSAWSTVFSSPEGMIELHNTRAFVRALSEQLAPVEVADAIDSQLQRLLEVFSQLV